MKKRGGPTTVEWSVLAIIGFAVVLIAAILYARSNEVTVRQVPVAAGVETVTGTYEVHCVSVGAWTTESPGAKVSKALSDWLAANGDREIVDIVHCEGGQQLVIIARRR